MAELTITHTHAEGTTLTGSARGDGVLEIVRLHRFQWRRYAGIHIPGSRDRRARLHLIGAAKAALEAAGHTVTLEVDDAYRAEADVVADRAERAEDRADVYAALAAVAAGRCEAARGQRDEIAGRRPLGQPILTDHHSAAGHRRDLARVNALNERSRDQADRADHYAYRARAALINEAHKHNGPAVMRRIETREAERRGWKRHLDVAASDDSRAHYQTEIDHLDDQLAYDRAILVELEAAGTYVQWRREHFQPGDKVRIWGHLWLTVKRVNAKSVSVIDEHGYPRPVPWDDLTGRRRDGWQWDTPNAEPWPVEQAKKVARWTGLAGQADNTSNYSDDAMWARLRVGAARRLVHGLSVDASDAEVEAFRPPDDDITNRRALAVACLDIHERLTAGETAADVAATLTPFGSAAWTLPDGDPTDVRAPDVASGDLVKGIWDRGAGGRHLWRHFAGPVADVSPVKHRGERGDWVTITLVDGTVRELQTHQWLAVYRPGGGS